MSKISRRDVVKLAGGVAVGVTTMPRKGHGQVNETDQPGEPAIDQELERALRNPQSFMFIETVTLLIDEARKHRPLYITSARDVDKQPTQVRVPTGSMRIFRADAGRDAFTRQGGVYWRILKDAEETVKFKEPGALVLIVREDEVVRCYTLEIDARC